MIKHLKPRSKKELRIIKIKNFFEHFFDTKFKWIRTSHLLNNNKWKHFYNLHKSIHEKYQENEWKVIYPYIYKTSKNEIQETSAIVKVTKRLWFKTWHKLPVRLIKKKVIDVWFTPAVGEKDRCAGCDYQIKKGETALDTLRRMEKERKF